MVRVLLVDDSAAVRRLLADRFAQHGYEVTGVGDAMSAAECALSEPPDFVVTDLWMPGVSGVQLCRLLKAERRTAHVPVILITGESQRRSRFWARTAGAVAYVAKNDPAALFDTLERLTAEFPPRARVSIAPVSRAPAEHRLLQRLDAALFESVVAGEVRALAHEEGEAESVFRGLVKLTSDVAEYRWLAVKVESTRRIFIHTRESQKVEAEAEARAALSVAPDVEASFVIDDRAVPGHANAPVVAEVRAGDRAMGTIALGPSERGASRDDRELVSIVAAELGGPLRVVSLVEHSQRIARSDPLTGLLNRRAFAESMLRSLGCFERYAVATSVLLLDIDHFKRVNDTLGHDAGDAVLVAIGEVLAGVARKTDVVARWGGEEFVVGLSHTGAAGAMIAAERARRAIMDRKIQLPGARDVTVTASVGVATAVDGERLDALIARADHAMYLAKSRGRNRCEIHEGSGTMQRSTAPAPRLAAVAR